MDNDKLKLDVQRVLQVFAQNEMGNKLTQFNLMGLTQMVLGVIDGTVVVQNGPAPNQPAPVETHRVEMPLDDDEDTDDMEAPKVVVDEKEDTNKKSMK